MSFIKLIDRINIIHKLILNENTGTPARLAERLGVSRSTVYNLLEDLKSYDAPIEYSRSRETFFYTKEYYISLNYSITLINDEGELQKVSGGADFITSVQYFGWNNIIFVI